MPEVKFLGHSCVTITEGDHKLIIDPFLSMNPQASVDMANIDAKYGLVRQNCSGLAAFAHQWAEKSLHAQDETGTSSTLNHYFASLTGVDSPGQSSIWIANNTNCNWPNTAGKVRPFGRQVDGQGADPEDAVEDVTPPDKIPRNPFNGVSVYALPNFPTDANAPITGAIACGGIDEGSGGWYYYALVFQGTDSTNFSPADDASFHAGQGVTSLAGLRNGIFMARLR